MIRQSNTEIPGVRSRGHGGEILRDNDYAKFIVMEQWRQRPDVIERYGAGTARTLCWQDLTPKDRTAYNREVREFKRRYPIKWKFHCIEAQADLYKELGAI
jgi:hypothetical protein